MLLPLISGSGTDFLHVQQYGGDSLDPSHYSTLHSFINGFDLGSYDSNAGGPTGPTSSSM